MGWLDLAIKGANLAASAVETYSTIKSIELAQEQQDAQEAEYRRQQRLAAAKAKREARIKKAQLYASQGSSGALTSTAKMGVIGIDTTLSSGLEDLESRTDYNVESSKYKESAAVYEGAGSALSGIATVAAESQSFLKSAGIDI